MPEPQPLNDAHMTLKIEGPAIPFETPSLSGTLMDDPSLTKKLSDPEMILALGDSLFWPAPLSVPLKTCFFSRVEAALARHFACFPLWAGLSFSFSGVASTLQQEPCCLGAETLPGAVGF